MELLLGRLLRSLVGGFQSNFLEVSQGFRTETSTPRQLRRSLGPLPETSVRTPPNFREVPPWATHRAGESEPRPTSGSTSGTTSGPTSGPTSAPTRSPTRAPTTGPTRVNFPVFCPLKDNTKAPTKRPTSHEGVHGSAHESVQSSGRGSPVLFSLVLILFVGHSRSFSSREAGWKIVVCLRKERAATPAPAAATAMITTETAVVIAATASKRLRATPYFVCAKLWAYFNQKYLRETDLASKHGCQF